MTEVISITLEGVSFNATALAKKSEAEFVREFEKTPVFSQFTATDRKKLLKDAHGLCVDAVKPKKAAEYPAQKQ